MSITVASTSDTPEAVQAANGAKPQESKATETPAQAPAEGAEQKTASESGTEEPETKGEDEAEESDAKEGAEDTEASAKGKKSKGGFQRRIDKLNAKKSEAERERDYWRNLATQKGSAGGESPKPPAAAQPAGKPQAGNFETHSDYVEALTDWKVAEARKADRAEAERNKVATERQQLAKTYSEKESTFAEKTEDYHEALADVEDIILPQALTEAIIQSEDGPALAYALAKNRKELERISKLSPIAAVRELGKFEAKLTPQGSAESKAETKTTKAPKPINPVGGKGAAVEKDIYDVNISQKEYERIRAKQRAQRTG